MNKNQVINIIGGGLAGSEASLYLARHGYRVNLYEQKPLKMSPAHHSNNFGEFEGHWEEDFMFPTKEREFGFKLRYLRVDKKDTNLDVDGVIGLGYSDHFPDNTNIYKILSKMKSIFNFKNVMTYDKAHSKLVLGEVPDFDSFNPVDFDIHIFY